MRVNCTVIINFGIVFSKPLSSFSENRLVVTVIKMWLPFVILDFLQNFGLDNKSSKIHFENVNNASRKNINKHFVANKRFSECCCQTDKGKKMHGSCYLETNCYEDQCVDNLLPSHDSQIGFKYDKLDTNLRIFFNVQQKEISQYKKILTKIFLNENAVWKLLQNIRKLYSKSNSALK